MVVNDATRVFVKEHLYDDVRRLALAKPPAGVDMLMALTQIEGFQAALHKLPAWAATEGMLWPCKLALEQCSSEATARYKHDVAERLLHGQSHEQQVASVMADITGGLGVDFAALAPLFTRATYIEQQAGLCELARNNFACIGLDNVEIVCDNGMEWLAACPAPLTLLYIDPARRNDAGRKVTMIEDCRPDVAGMQHTLHRLTRFCLIKLSPMLDITAAVRAMTGVTEVHIVEYQGECKELLLVIDYGRNEGAEPQIHCTDLTAGQTFSFTRTEEVQTAAMLATSIETYLYEPGAALLKAGAFNLISIRYGLRKLARMTHLYTGNHLVDNFQGRVWQVVDSCGFAKHELKRMLDGTGRAELSVRGFPMSVTQLRRQLRLKDGGSTHLIATTLGNGKKVLISVKAILQRTTL